MDSKQFMDLVKQMRVAQKAYFRERRREDLNACKRIEARVDAEIKRVELETAPNLFNQ